MPVNQINPPFPTFNDQDGYPLNGGYIYIGQPGFEAQSTPKASFFDVGMTIPSGSASGAAVRVNGGYAVYNGAPSLIYADGPCSITVKDQNDVLIFSTLNYDPRAGLGIDGDDDLTVNTFTDLIAMTSAQVAVGSYVLVKKLETWYKRLASGGNLTHTAATLAWEVQTQKGIYDVTAFGAFGTGVSDDTPSIRAAVTAAQLSVRNAGTTKQEDGAVVLFPKGLFRITGTITISESNIHVRGLSASASALYAPNANFDLLVFENVSFALYNCGVSDLRFLTPGNATAGYGLKVMNCINFNHHHTLFNGWWGGIYIAGGGKIINTSVIMSQETRNPATPLTGQGWYVGPEYGITGDLHFTDCQIMEDVATAGLQSVIIRCGDGIYINNCHIHGQFLVEPRGTGGENTLATLVIANSYLDASRDVSLHLTGAPIWEYRDIRIHNTHIRAGVIGVRVNPTTPIFGLSINGGIIAQNGYWGVECLNANIVDMKIDGVTFNNNNVGNYALVGDIRLNGSGTMVSGCTFSGGDAAGRSIQVDAGATFAQLRNLSFVNSTVPAAQRISDAGSATAKSGIVGVTYKNVGSVVALSGATTATVTHGLDVTPAFGSINITPAGLVPQWFINGLNATQFVINFASPLGVNTTVAWSVDAEN